MNPFRWRAAVLGAFVAGLRPLGVGLFAKLVALLLPEAALPLDAAALAGGAASLLAIARSLLDDLLDPARPARLLQLDVQAAGLFHEFGRRLVAWLGYFAPVCLFWGRMGFRPELEEVLWLVLKLGVAWLAMTRLLHKRRLLRLVRPEAGTGHRLLHTFLSRSYLFLVLCALVVLAFWGAGYLELAAYLARAGVGTLAVLTAAALGWSAVDRRLPRLAQAGEQSEDADSAELDLAELSGGNLVTWTPADLLRGFLKVALLLGTGVAVYFFWGGSVEGFRILSHVFHATADVGGFQISLARLVEAVVAVGVLMGISALIRRFLETQIFPNTPLDRGMRLAINSFIHYVLMGIAMLMVIEAFGVATESIKWFAGFVGVGVGFGMQAIVNNLASGIIILIERPVKPGDRVKVGDIEGEVTRVSVRATVIRSLDNIETIVPNSEFIGQAVTNWSFTDTNVRLHIPVGVAYGSDVKRVRDALMTVAQKHRLVLKRPGPEVRFDGFGDSSLNFELLIWTQFPFLGPRILSDLNYAIDAEFRRREIEIPFPQRDLHIRSGLPAALFAGPAPPSEVEAPAPQLPEDPRPGNNLPDFEPNLPDGKKARKKEEA